MLKLYEDYFVELLLLETHEANLNEIANDK